MESNEEIERKLKELRTHVPFVERMISKVSKGNNPRSQSQLQRLQGLHSFLMKPMAKAPKMEMLLKMEAVLNSMKDKVQKSESTRPGSGSQQSPGNIKTGGSTMGQLPTNPSPQGHISTQKTAASKDVKQHLGTGHLTSHKATQDHGSGNKTSPSCSQGAVTGHVTVPGSSGGPGPGDRQLLNKPESKEDTAKERRDFLFERPKDARKSMDQPVQMERHRNNIEDKNKERGDNRIYSSQPSKLHDRSKGETVDPRIRSGVEVEKKLERSSFLRHSEGESSHKAHRQRSHSDTRQEEGKSSSKRNSLLDLPMPPCAPSGNASQPNRESGNERQAFRDKFNSSREKLQKLFGITGDSSRTEKGRDGGSRSASDLRVEQRSNWRDDVRARAPLMKESIRGASEDLERRDREYMHHRSLSSENISSRSFHQPQISNTYSHSKPVGMEPDPHRRLSSSSAFPKVNNAEEICKPPPDSPMSPVQSPVHSSIDTPQSPDQEASFSPVLDSEDPSPVKTIPLQKQNLQEKGVDLDAIRKALAQIHSSERSKSGSGPSYRYEDFVGPAAKDDEPYDPEEVWKSVDSAPTHSRAGGSSSMSTMVSSHKDVDLRQIPQAFTSRVNERSNQSMSHGAKDIDSRKIMLGHVSQIPLPQRSGSSHSGQSSMTHGGLSAQSGIRSSAWDQDIRNQRIDPRSVRGNAADVDMRFQHYRPPQPPGHSPQSQHASVPSRQPVAQTSYPPLPRQPPVPQSAHPPLPAMPPPPLPESPQPPLPRSPPPPPSVVHADKESKKETPSRIEHIRSKLAQNAGEFIRPGQRGVALSQLEKYKLKRQTCSELKSPPHSSSSSSRDPLSKKSDVHPKSTSVLDMLLPESKSETVSKTNQPYREPEKPHKDASAPQRDPRIGPQESKMGKEKDTPVRDPRLSSGSGISSSLSAKSHPLGDPRKDLGKFSHLPMEKRDESSTSGVNEGKSREERDPRKFLSSSGSQARNPSVSRDPRQEHGLMKRDSRHEVGMVSRDPRKDFGSIARDPRQDHKIMNRDPRQPLTQMGKERMPDFGTPNRDPRQDHGKVSNSIPLGREPHQDMGSFVPVSGSRDPRHDSGPYSKMSGPPFRDPRLIARSDRPAGNVWSSGSHAVTPNYLPQNMTSKFVQPNTHAVSPGFIPSAAKPSLITSREIMETDPAHSASGSLIGQTFTCLMMRGLPPFVHSHHIYRFFEEYFLRDISIELDNNYNCKGAAYVHFPSHASAREALEKMNGYLLHGSPISLRICTVGILRQAKNAYEQLNRDREARLGLPERPRGNANPFYKPRPKEPVISTPPAPVPSKAVEDKAEVTKSEKTAAEEEEEEVPKSNSGRYSVLCGVKVSSVATSSFKIPKIKKGEPEKPKLKESSAAMKGASKTSKSLDKNAKAESKEKKYISKTFVSDSSDSDIDVPLDKTPKTRKKRIIKKMIIDSDSDSEPQKAKKSQAVASVKKRETSSSEDDSDSSSMVIDESAQIEEEEEETSDVSSDVSEPQIDQRKKNDNEKMKKQVKKKSKVFPKKAKPIKTSVKHKKPQENVKKKSAGKKTKSKKQPKNKFEFDDYKEGMKLTRHTQGELEEIIPTQNKLKVIIPVPHRFVDTLFEDDKGKKKGTKRRATDLQVSPSLPPPVAEIIPDEHVECVDVKEESDSVTKKAPVKKKQEIQKKPGPKKRQFVEPLVRNKLPGSSRGVIPLVLEKLVKGLSYWTPTSKRGQKRKSTIIRRPISRKKARRNSSGLDVLRCWSEGTLGNLEITPDQCDTMHSESDFLGSDVIDKRPISSPTEDFAAKRPRLEKEVFSSADAGVQESQSGLDVFDNSSISDELSDLTQLTPSILEVEPTICNALPDASVLANVLSPPHLPPQSNDNSVSSVSELVEDHGESSLADIANRLPVKFGTTPEQGKDVDRSENESTCVRVEDGESFDKENDEDSLSKTVSQLVESLDESIMKEELSLDKRNENIQETIAGKTTAAENVCATTTTELPGDIGSKGYEIPTKVSEEKQDDVILKTIAIAELRREETLAAKDALTPLAGEEESSNSQVSDVIKTDPKDMQQTPAERSPVISDQVTSNSSAESDKTSKISEDVSAKSQVVAKHDIEHDISDPKLSEKMTEPPKSDIIDIANAHISKSEDFKDTRNVDDHQKLENNSLTETKADLQCKTQKEIKENDVVSKNSCKLESVESKEKNEEVLLTSVKKQDEVESKCSEERNAENASNAMNDAEDSKTMELDKIHLDSKEFVLDKSVTVSDADVSYKKTDLIKTTIDSKAGGSEVLELGSHNSESVKPDEDKCYDNKMEDGMETKVSNINKAEGEEPDDDDTASIGKTSTCSFVDDASIVSSEGRELKTPDFGSSKKSKRAKSSALSIPLECRRVTRGSLIEPRVVETTEWDDGGVIDLFQCDLCDYVGRRVGSHLVNYHAERELLCEFKKEDFGPVIRDHVGPSKDRDDTAPDLDLSWIPEAMTFDHSVTCKQCDYFSNSRFDLIYHYLEHFPKSTEKVHHCRFCNYMSGVKEDFYNHVSSHTGEYRYTCDLCCHKAYKESMMKDHHADSHPLQTPKYSVSSIIEEEGWLYIHVCKVCMFVRIGSEAAEQHVQCRHGGKADIHKANMSRPVVLHSEVRKAGEGEHPAVPRPRYKGKKKKGKGKKGPDLDVFVGDEDEKEVKEETEEKAKQLVDRIASNMHTTTSAHLAQKRMSLLNTIFQKLDNKDESDTLEQGSSQEPCGLEPGTQTVGKHDKIVNAESNLENDAVTETTLTTNLGEDQVPKIVKDKSCPKTDESNKDNSDELPPCDDFSEQSDTDSTISAVDASVLDGEQLAVGSGTLQDTIRKLSAQLDEVAKEKADSEKIKLGEEQSQMASAATLTELRKSTDTLDDDSDSDALVICEDGENDEENSFQGDDIQQDPLEVPTTSSLQNTIQSILRETSEVPPASKLPLLRVRPAHQLIDPKYRDPQFRIVSKHQQQQQQQQQKKALRGRKTSGFFCEVSECKFKSDIHNEVLRHIIETHGPYKCVASGCHFVSKSKDVYIFHMQHMHPKLNFLVCPFLCKVTFKNFTEHLEHLSQHDPNVGGEVPTIAEVDNEDQSDSGFLRIESVSTLDPTAASQMFGEDFNTTSITPTAPYSASPFKITVSRPMHASGQNVPSPFVTSTAPVQLHESDKSSQKPFSTGTTTQSKTMPVACIDITKGSESSTTTSSLEPKTTLSKSSLGGNDMDLNLQNENRELGKPAPSVVNLDEDEGEHVGGNAAIRRPPPPGLATLPRCPPTVPIQDVFREYQPVDIFKILTTKLAPEVFKCMFRGCVFADDEPDTFLAHVTGHGIDFRCCYCLMLMPTASELVEHVLTEHSNCQFQCKYCLYRAFTKIYMGVHLKNFHPYDEPRYIKVGTIRNGYPPSPPIDQFVRPYRCNYMECQYRTVDSEAFRIHVQQTHGPFIILSCDFCHKHLHVIPLIEHMREHQMHAHQCPYCLHGDVERERLLGHLLNCHSGRRGKVLVRKHNEEETPERTSNLEELSSPPPPPSSPSIASSANSSSNVLPQHKTPEKFSSSTDFQKKCEEETPPGTSNAPNAGKEVNQSQLEGRRISRSMSHDLGEAESSSSSGQTAEKTGLSGHALYRCGNNGCEYTSLTQLELREHLQVCDLTLDSTTKCYHCGKHCRHLSTLFDHLRVHGPKRYCCGVTGCDYRATMAHYFKNHMKQIHHCSGFKHLIKDPKVRDPELQEYVVYPKDAVLPLREGHKKKKNEFSFEDIPRIPRAHILYQDLKCYHCQYITKIRLNLIKHLRLHEKYPDGIPEKLHISHGVSSPIPFKQPINPVPCLERKELMFDKMMNLAGSSFDSKIKRDDDMRKKHPIPQEEYEKLPKFVPEERLHSCGIQSCNYVSCDDMMLKYHIRSLHSDMTTFPCPHCTDQTITMEKMSSHFKLHGDRLYRCGWCPYLSSRRNVVERHMKEKHNGRKSFEFVIREPVDPDAPKKPDDQPVETWLKKTSKGSPVKGEYVCPVCRSFKTVCLPTFRSHLCREADYDRYQCVECGVSNALLPNLQRHYVKMHQQSFGEHSYLELPVEEEKDAWVESVITHQNHLIKVWEEKGGDANHEPPPPSPAKSSKVLTSSPVSSDPTSEVPSQQVGVVLHDSGSERGRFFCDVCGCECRTAAGLKSHTTAMHQTRYKCHYCPYASNNEDAVKQHCSLKHPKLQNEVLDVSQCIRAQKGDEGESLSSPTKAAEGSTEISSAESGHKSGVETSESDMEVEKVADSGKIYKCQFCSFTTNASYTLYAHKRKKHADLRMFQCNHCGNRFNSNNDAIRHHKWKHQQLKPHITFLDKGNEDLLLVGESDEDTSDASFTFPVPESTSKRSPRHLPDQELRKTKVKRSHSGGRDSPVLRESPSVSSLSDADVNTVSDVKGANEAQVMYSCCHCNHKSSKEVMEDHMKTQHRDLPYQVRREEHDRVFTEVYIYKCIHCIVESLSHAQSMDHWIQNHALLEFKYKMVLRHSGEVSNQVVTSTTSDKDPVEFGNEELVKCLTGDPSVSTTSSALGNDASSSVVITSSSEGSISTSSGTPLPVGKRRGSNLEMASPHRYSIDTEDDDQSEVGETVDEGDTGIPTTSDVESEEMMYKCGYCKKSSSSMQDIDAHLSTIHSDKPTNVKKLKLDVFDQLYRAEYECGYCSERGRNAKMKQHQKSAHPNQPPKFTRVQKAPRENICYRCEVCAHVVKNLPSIRSHIRRQHPEANEFTFTKLTLGSPMRFPIKQPYKCNYCGDVGESVQEMKSHHTFLHSHLEFSIRNLRDEALSSVHSSSMSLNPGESFPGSVKSSPAYASSSVVGGPKSAKSKTLSRVKNTARKSFLSPVKRTVAMKSTAKACSNASSSSASEQTSVDIKESTPQHDKVFACVDLGGGFPVKLTVQKLGEVLNLQPQVLVDSKAASKLV